MRIVILTYGSRGDVQPYVALGVGLRRAGYTVRLAAPEVFTGLVEANGLEFAPLAGDPTRLAQDLVDRAGGNYWRTVRVLGEYTIPLGMAVLAGIVRACQDSDAIIHSFLVTVPGHQQALLRGVPDFFAQVYPIFSSTRSFPGLMFPPLPRRAPLRRLYNRLTHDFFTGVFRRTSQGVYALFRRRYADLPPFVWPFAPGYAHRPPMLYGFSPQVIPRAPEWDAQVHVTGAWLLDAHQDWQPPDELLAFLDAGPPPVYIGFGSMLSRNAVPMTRLVLDAIRQSGQRAVLSTGWGGVANPQDLLTGEFGKAEFSAGQVYVAGYVPHDWLFPRMAAVVHHGGAGTTAAALRSGVPAVVVPFTADQFFWGRRVCELGAGPEALPAKTLSAERLAYALRIAATHEPLRRRAAALGERLRAEDGVGAAVRLIKGYLGR